ncbi:MAG: hypothetical protein HYR64_00245 [Fimbriimonas ginsengisoli]|uniref:Uncharacterized protein n=1 Tax=Fimbriimonas ginsengisoli TaxID=1005039 RepID=A0A931PUT9_FIMGI|nr:hypothetical protein [Fimbriimonas ginsengisoli]
MSTELSDEETEALIERAAKQIERRGMEVPAVLMLEMHKPLSYVASQAAIVFAPFLVPVLGYNGVHDYSRLLTRRENVEKLICRLEAGAQTAKAATEAPCNT